MDITPFIKLPGLNSDTTKEYSEKELREIGEIRNAPEEPLIPNPVDWFKDVIMGKPTDTSRVNASYPERVVDRVMQSVVPWIGLPPTPHETIKKAEAGDVGSQVELAAAPLMLPGVPVLKPIMKTLGAGARMGLRALNTVSDNPLTHAGQVAMSKIWDYGVAAPMNYITDPRKSLLANSSLPDPLKNYLGKMVEPFQKGGRFIREQVEPAIERLPESVQNVIRTARAQETLIAQEGNKLAKDMIDLPLSTKMDIVRGLRGESLGSLTTDAANAITQSRARIRQHGIDPGMVQTANDKASQLFTSLLKSPHNVLTDPNMRIIMDSLEQSVPAEAWFRNVRLRGAIKQAISDPTMPIETRTLLTEMYQLPATTPEIALQSARAASNEYLKGELFRVGQPMGLISPVRLPGMVETSWGPLKGTGMWLDRDLALELEALQKIEKYSHSVWNRYFTTPWKTMKIVLSPGAQLRNTFTNFMLNDIGGLPVYRMDVYKDAFSGMMKNSSDWKDFVRLTGGGGTFSRNDLTALEATWKYNVPWYEVPSKLLERGSQLPRTVYNANEQVFKFAKYIHNLEQGLPKQKAAFDALKPTFNYSEITPAVGLARSSVMPFATWTSKVIPYTFEQAVKHPIRVGKWWAMYEGLQNMALQQSGMSKEEWDDFKSKMPDHVQKGLYLLMPWRDSRDRLNMLDLTYIVPGIGDMREMVGRGMWEAIYQHPLITIPADLLRNKKFTGEPIRYDWQPWQVRRWNDMQHMWESVMPSWFGPWGTDYKRYVRSLSDQPGAQTVGQAIAAQFGVRIQPLDEIQIMSLYDSQRKRYESEITMEMNKELRRTQDPDKQREIVEKYAKMRERFLADYLNQPGIGEE